MKICFPTQDTNGLNSMLHGHFGSAPYFTVVDSETEEVTTISNSNAHHQHGQCSPLKTVGQTNIDAVVCRGMGRRAVQALLNAGITVYIGEGPTVSSCMNIYKTKKLTKLSADSACQEHGHHSH
jgi:predicted Fe-Mo cluster-binding NifX family protein